MVDALIGRQLGDYVIQELLGRGGMARVYKGFDDRLQRYAAVKVISNDFATADQAEYTERFRREARSIARLHHPNVVGVYQFGEYELGYYMAMVFIEGKDLRQILKEYNDQGQYLPHNEVIDIVRGIGNALDYAHGRGVIHRDIKPSNIMLDAENRAILTDFGLALNASEGTLGDTFGSAHYIAPEQAVSSAKAVGQSDLYSLGVCMYEMLTGKVPFDDPSAMSVALKHLNEMPPAIRLFNPTLPPAVERVINKIMDKDPARRYPTGAALALAIEQALTKNAFEEETAELPVGKIIEPNRKSDVIQKPSKRSSVEPAGLGGLVSAQSEPAPIFPDEETTNVVVLTPDSDPSRPSKLFPPKRDLPTDPDTRSKRLFETYIGESASKYVTSDSQAKPIAIDSGEDSTAAPQRNPLIFAGIGGAVVVGIALLLILTGALRGGNPTPTPEPSSTTVENTATSVAVAATELPTTTIPTEKPTLQPTTAVPTTAIPTTIVPTTAVPPTTLPAVVATDAPTETIATDVPTSAPTLTDTIEASATPTETASVTTTVEVVATTGNERPVDLLLVYDREQFIAANVSGRILDISQMVFTQHGSTVRRYPAFQWSSPTGASSPSVFIPRRCFQLGRAGSDIPNTFSECGLRAGYLSVSPRSQFWIAQDENTTTFDVELGSTVIATCEIVAMRCEVKLP